jgi:signal transduction histidine kinase/CheY-like chemotaxis protein
MQLNKIMKTFNLENRDISMYTNLYLDYILDQFYIKVEASFPKFINRDSIPRLKRVQKELLISIFKNGLDRDTYNEFVKVSKYYKSSDFEEMDLSLLECHLIEIFQEISLRDSNIHNDLPYITKLIKAIFMTIVLESKNDKSDQSYTITELLIQIYMVFSYNKSIITNIKNSNYAYDVSFDINISVNTLYKELQNKKELFAKINLDIDSIMILYRRFINELKDYNEKQNFESFKKLHKISRLMEDIFDKVFQHNMMSITILSVNSSLEFLKTIPDIMYDSQFFNLDKDDLNKQVKAILLHKLLHVLGWAINDIRFSEIFDKDADVSKKISINEYKMFVNIYIKSLPNSLYIKSLIHNLLDVIEIVVFLKENEFKLLELADKAETANRAKDMFLANMSHELRTPLNAIIGFSQILVMKSDVPDNVKNYIDKINIAGKNLLSLVNTILDFAKLEAGKIEVKKEIVSIKNILNEVVILIEPMAHQNNINIQYPTKLSLNILADEKNLKEVFLNILSNAVKFTKDGDIKIDVKYDINSKKHLFSICDTGIGISKENILKLFNPFTQIDNPMQKSVKGTGLGLVIIKKIVELHGGDIWVESQKDEGTCFYFTIPISDHIDIEHEKIEQDSDKKVLIVEDDSMFVDLYKECMPKVNLTITNSVNKANAILEEEYDFDLILLDYYLIDGISMEVLMYLDRQKLSIPIYIITAEEDLVNSELREHPMIKDIILKNESMCTVLKELKI